MGRVGFWWRLLAALIDGAILLLSAILFGAVMAYYSTSPAQERAFDLIFFGVVLLYSLTEIFFRGTPGKRMLGIWITCADGSPPDRWRLLTRWSTKQCPLILALLFVATDWVGFRLVSNVTGLFVFIGCFFAANEDKLAWHDQWAGTAVSRKAKAEAQGFPVIAGEIEA